MNPIIPIYSPNMVVPRGLPIKDLKELTHWKRKAEKLKATMSLYKISCEVKNLELGGFPLIVVNWYPRKDGRYHLYPIFHFQGLLKHVNNYEPQMSFAL